MLTLIYLVSAGKGPLSTEMTAPRDIVEGSDFFQGIYAINTKELEAPYGSNGENFNKTAQDLGGQITKNADYSALFRIFPKLTAEFLLWEEDDEFPARINILLAKNTIEHYPPDATAMVVNLLCSRLLFKFDSQ